MSKGGWEKVTWKIEPPKLGPHSWTATKVSRWTYCTRCGIMITKSWGKVKFCNNCRRPFNSLCDGG